MEFRQSVTIQRSLDTVFAFMSDAENDVKWRSNVKEIRRLSGGGQAGAGTVYRQVIKGPFGVGFDADLTYTGFEHNRRFAFDTTSGAIRPSAVIEFSPISEDATEVRFTMTWTPEGAFRLAAPLVGRILRRGIHRSYRNLVRYLEASPA